MPYEISYPGTVELARQAYRLTVWRDSLGWRLGFLLVAFLSCLAVFAKSEPVFAGFGLGVSLAFAVSWYLSRSQFATRAARRAGPIRWRFEEEALHVETDDRQGTFQWWTVEKLRRFPEIWILQFDGSPTPLPASVLSTELREFLERKVREAGGKVA